MNYPTNYDNAASFGLPLDQTSTASLATTLTANVGTADTTIQVANAIGPGFAVSCIIRIDDEFMLVTARTATTFDVIRHYGGSTAAAHTSGAPVRSTISAQLIKNVQDAIVALQQVIGLAGAYLFALSSHQHAGGDITSGTVAAARLPTATGASSGAAGTAGILAAPPAGNVADVLRRDLTWGAASGGSVAASGVAVTPAGSIASTDVQAAIQELDSEKAGASHTHAASAITFTPYGGGGIGSNNVQDAMVELADERVPTSRQVNTGAGLQGGGNLAGNLTLTADVRQVFGRTGNVTAFANDYADYQIASNPAGWPGWMNGSTTVRQALDAIVAKITDVVNTFGSYYTKSEVDAGLNGKSSSTHYHNETGTSTSGPIG